MQKIKGRLTVYFEAPFWVCVYERIQDGNLEACKITFGAEPKDYQVLDYLLEHWWELRFSPAVRVTDHPEEPKNPKRMQREIARQLSGHGTGTKSQQALQLQRECARQTRRRQSREECEAERLRRYAMRRQKKKEKKRGH